MYKYLLIPSLISIPVFIDMYNKKYTNKVNKDVNKSLIVEGCRGNSHAIYSGGCLCGEFK